MIIVVGANDAHADLADLGVDLRRMLWRVEKAFAVVALEPMGLTILFADDEASAAAEALRMINLWGGSRHGGLDAPLGVREIVQAHAAGLH